MFKKPEYGSLVWCKTPLHKIKSKISDALPYYVFDDQTTSAHLRSMINKINSIWYLKSSCIIIYLIAYSYLSILLIHLNTLPIAP